MGELLEIGYCIPGMHKPLYEDIERWALGQHPNTRPPITQSGRYRDENHDDVQYTTCHYILDKGFLSLRLVRRRPYACPTGESALCVILQNADSDAMQKLDELIARHAPEHTRAEPVYA